MIRVALLALAIAAPAAARNVDSGSAPDFADGRGLVRLDYANDLFTASDRYYTEGFGLDFYHPALGRSPVSRALLSVPGGARAHGLILRASAFTPSQIGERTALVGDRPWASYAFLGQQLVSEDPRAGLTVVSELDAGVIGPAAGGQAQVKIHARIGTNVPRGWDNQIRNNPILDYYLRVEKIALSASWGELALTGDATAGTLYDNAALGAAVRMGRLAPRGRKRFYVYARGEEKAVAYDATLQGGLFNRPSSYYVTPASQVERLVYRWDAGVALDFDSFAVEAARTAVGREFSGAIPHQWAEIGVMKRF